MTSVIGFIIVCIIGVICVAWWWRKKKETAWLYTFYVAAVIGILTLFMISYLHFE